MMDELQLFRGRDYQINDCVTIAHPKLGEICDFGEQRYYGMVSTFCSTPSDFKVQLWDNFGIDYEKLDEFDFFCMLSTSFDIKDTSILFGDLDFRLLNFSKNEITDEIVLQNGEGRVVLDKGIYFLATNFLRTIHGFEKHVDVAGSEDSKRYLIDKERRKLQHSRNKKEESILVPLVSSLVNCQQFKYNHETVWNLPIYTFMDSVKRIQKLKQYDQVMQGVYAGTIDSKALSPDSMNWIGSLNSR